MQSDAFTRRRLHSGSPNSYAKSSIMEKQMTSRLEAGQLATVFGGSGFVGRHAVRALAKDGWRVRAAVRRPDLAGHLQPMGRVGQIMPIQANIRYPDSLKSALDGANVAINLVAILAKSGAQTFDKVHIEGARAVARAARFAGVQRFVHVSAIGADANSKGDYGRTKALGEAAVLDEFPETIILRPSIIFGPEDQFFNRFAGLARMSPFLPLIGGGKTRFQPVFVGDVAAAIAAAASGRAKPGTIYELGGPDVATFRELLDKTLEWSGRTRMYLRLPFWLAKFGAALTAPLPNSMRPLTVDQVRMLQSDNVVSKSATEDGRTLAGLGITPQSMATVVPAYLERFQRKGQYTHYRG
jgi:NADH dehydrogenase